jgi:DNA primase
MADRDDQKRLVQQASDIARLIGQDVALHARGREFVGLCPFHADQNPSMYVVPAKQIYHCFVCGAGGDAFSWMMNYHKMTFPQALEHLAERAGIKLQRNLQASRSQGPTERERILDANAKAVAFFSKLLQHPTDGREARHYVQKRDISPEMVQAFQIGYAPDGWEGLARAIAVNGWDQATFELAGLIARRENQQASFYDRLRHRLIFPICDSLGRPIAFGGRKLREEDNPKYLNSPETPLFHKSATLYGLHLAKKAIIHDKTAVIVEGYTDVVACHQAGVRNVVATLGTALTSEHVQQLRHFAQQVVLIFDADEAGQKAADRAVEVFLGGDIDVSIAVLPDALDPADLLNQPDGAQRWHQAVQQASDALSYQFQRVRQQFDQATTMTGRQQVAEAYLRKLSQLGLGRMGVIRRAMVMQRLAEMLHLNEQTLVGIVQRLTEPSYPASPSVRSQPTHNSPSDVSPTDVASAPVDRTIRALQVAEREVIGCLLRDGSLFHQPLWNEGTLDEALPPQEMITPEAQALYQVMYEWLCEGATLTLAQLLADLAAEGRPELVQYATAAEALVERVSEDSHQRVVDMLRGAVIALQRYHREQEYQAARRTIELPEALVDQEQLLHHVAEHHRMHPSAIRIARVRPNT